MILLIYVIQIERFPCESLLYHFLFKSRIKKHYQREYFFLFLLHPGLISKKKKEPNKRNFSFIPLSWKLHRIYPGIAFKSKQLCKQKRFFLSNKITSLESLVKITIVKQERKIKKIRRPCYETRVY